MGRGYWSNPEKEKAYAKTYRETHKEQRAAYMKLYRANNRAYYRSKDSEWRAENRAKHLARLKAYHALHYHKRYPRFGKEQFAALQERQGFLCCICQQKKRLIVDHCHQTGLVRGLLCYRCNIGVGWFEIFHKQPSLLQRVTDYIEGRLA